MAACRYQDRGQPSSHLLIACDHLDTVCAHLVYEVSVDTVGQLLDEGVHDELHVGACVGLLVLLFCTFRRNRVKMDFTSSRLGDAFSCVEEAARSLKPGGLTS